MNGSMEHETSLDWELRMSRRVSPLSEQQIAARRETFEAERREQPDDAPVVTTPAEDELYISGRISIAEYQGLIRLKLAEARAMKALVQ